MIGRFQTAHAFFKCNDVGSQFSPADSAVHMYTHIQSPLLHLIFGIPRHRVTLVVMDWQLQHPQKHAIAAHLSTYRIASKDIIAIDSMVIQGIFGQHARKSPRHTHIVLQLSPDISLDNDSRLHIYDAFEMHKTKFDLDNAPVYFETSNVIAKDVYNGVAMIKSVGDGSYNTLVW